jgi:MFS family permease
MGALMAHVSGYDRRRRAQTMGYLSVGEDAGEVAGPILAGFLWSTWGVSVLLGVRIALSAFTEIYTIAVTGSLTRRGRARARRAESPEAQLVRSAIEALGFGHLVLRGKGRRSARTVEAAWVWETREGRVRYMAFYLDPREALRAVGLPR